jgi:hypothetical protein
LSERRDTRTDTLREEDTMTASTATTAPATETKGKRGRKSKDELAELPPLDLSALTIQTGVEMPKQKRQTADNPFIQHVKDSYEYEDARAVTVPTVNVGRVVSMIRRAADALSTDTSPVGVSVHLDEDGGNTTITFAAKERRARKSKEEATDEGEAVTA